MLDKASTSPLETLVLVLVLQYYTYRSEPVLVSPTAPSNTGSEVHAYALMITEYDTGYTVHIVQYTQCSTVPHLLPVHTRSVQARG